MVERARPASAAGQEFSRDVEAALMARELILHRIRTALGRSGGEPVAPPPPARIRVPEVGMEARIASMTMRVEALAGRTARTLDPRAWVEAAIAGKTAVASNAPFL